MNRKIVLLIFILLVFLRGKAQDYNYAHYTTQNGLAGSVVYCMAQDNDGFIWFGTETGLSRFDGARFRNFTSADGLPDNEILRMFVDSKNRVWIMPFKGSICYYWHGIIHNAKNDSVLRKAKVEDEVISIVENADGDIAILQKQALTFIRENGELIVFDKYKDTPSWMSYITYANLSLKDPHTFQCLMWIYPASAFIAEFRNGDLVKTREIDTSFVKLTAIITSYLSPDLEILHLKSGLQFYSPLTQKRSELPYKDSFIKLNRLNDSLVAINYSSFVDIYNIRSLAIETFSFKGKNVSSTLEDREGNLWFSTMGQGLYRLPSKEFRSYRFLYENDPMPVYVLKKYGNTVYAGSDHFRLWEVNTLNGKTTNRQLRKSNFLGRIIVIEKNQEGLFVAGDGLAAKINGQKVIPVRVVNSAIKSASFLNDTILLASNNSLLPVRTGDLKSSITFWSDRVTAVYVQHKKIFMGNLKGCYILEPSYMNGVQSELTEILPGRITSITGSEDGTVWIATHGDGVAGYKEGKIIARINESNGLTSNICQALFVKGKELWIGTDKGLNRVNFSDSHYRVTRYTMADGLMSNMINSIFVDSNTVYAGTPEGISAFDESKVFTRSMCNLKMTAIQGGGHRWLYDTSGLQFKPRENNIRFEFSGISFKSGGEMEYRYRLKGLSDQWQTTHDNFIEYAGLASGDYELELIAKNKFDVQSEPIRTRFTIAKFPWEETWFRILVIMLIASSVWLFVTYRIKTIREKAKLKLDTERKIGELEQMALKAQMNPHFIFNSLNSIQQYVIDKDVLGANKFITDFSRLVRLTLDLSSKSSITLQEEIKYISTYLKLEKIRFENKFSYCVIIGAGIDADSINIPPLVLQPYVENSIRHGVRYRDDNEGMITVEFKKEENKLVCIIEDNGVGRKASAQMKGQMLIEYQSKGMTLTARRIEMMNKSLGAQIDVDIRDVTTESINCTGTRVTIHFPIPVTTQTVL